MCTLVERHDERRPLGRPNHRCNDKIKMDLQERKWKDADWIDFDKVRQKCRDVVEKVTDIFVLWYKINFSADWENVGFLKRTLLYRISWLVRCLVSIFLWLHYFISCDCIILFLVTALLYFSWQHHFIFVTASLYFLWLHYFISCDCITLFLVTASLYSCDCITLFLVTALLYFSWLHYFISCDCITLFLVTALLYFSWLHYFISCDCITLFLVTALPYFLWLHYFISRDCITLFLVTASLYFLWLQYFISRDCITLFLVTASLYFLWLQYFISRDCITLFLVTASLYFSWLQHFISCDCSTLFLATALLHFSWLHYFISCMQPYNVIAVTSSVITFNYTFVNLKILVPVFYSASWMAMERMIACWFLEKPINFIFSTTCIVSLCPACPIIPNTYRLYFD